MTAQLATRSLALILLLGMLACGGSARERTLRATFIATNAARDGFTQFDAEHQA